MSLQEKLQTMAAASAKKFPAEAQSVMHRTTQAVVDSMGSRKIPGPGDMLPAFELPDSKGNLVSSVGLAEKGPFVLSFFRGKW